MTLTSPTPSPEGSVCTTETLLCAQVSQNPVCATESILCAQVTRHPKQNRMDIMSMKINWEAVIV